MGMNMNKMMKQVQKMQREMARVQEEMEAKTVTGTAGGGAVTVTVNGKLELLLVEIEPEVVDPDDVEMLQDLVMAATNEAIRESQDMMAQAMARFTGGLKIPGF
ncbi:MAG: YbaB/EbfC family nucleoid-associated protein [bacterium]|jgi:DNA-binding YbaB/EbfC family protein|nr:YbaB/EbfC family nucleoid-associated protein [Bacillota bacterium]